MRMTTASRIKSIFNLVKYIIEICLKHWLYYNCIEYMILFSFLELTNVIGLFRWGTRSALRQVELQQPSCCSLQRGCCFDRSSRTVRWPGIRLWLLTRSMRDTSIVTFFSGSCVLCWLTAQTYVSSSCQPPSTSNCSLTISAVLLYCRSQAGCFLFR